MPQMKLMTVLECHLTRARLCDNEKVLNYG